METSVRIELSDLDQDLLKKIKALFGKEREVVLTISTASDRPVAVRETKKAYLARLAKALKSLDSGRGRSLTEAQLDAMVLERLKG
ncbi:MAG: hypothetical protein WAT74_14725 [Flavobacteriales bacterium]